MCNGLGEQTCNLEERMGSIRNDCMHEGRDVPY